MDTKVQDGHSGAPARMRLDHVLYERWEDYVDPVRRWAVLRPQLLGIFPPGVKRPILDAAAGVGLEIRGLAHAGFSTIGNERDPAFRAICLEHLTQDGLAVPVLGAAWVDLPSYLPKGALSGVLLLGNSLPLLKGRRARQAVLRVFLDLLEPGGRLVLDFRDFSDLPDVPVGSRAALSPCFMYGGDTVHAVAHAVGKTQVMVTCVDALSGADLGSCVSERLSVPLVTQELMGVGFSEINEIPISRGEGRGMKLMFAIRR